MGCIRVPMLLKSPAVNSIWVGLIALLCYKIFVLRNLLAFHESFFASQAVYLQKVAADAMVEVDQDIPSVIHPHKLPGIKIRFEFHKSIVG